MKIKYRIIFIYIILLFIFSCAPSPEVTSVTAVENNFLLTGFWHGLILPFSIIGKLIGLPIGLWDTGKSGLTYWVGYGLSLILYLKILDLSYWYLKGLKKIDK